VGTHGTLGAAPNYRAESAIYGCHVSVVGWLGSRVVSVLDSGALGKLFTPIWEPFSVHQAAKVAALLRVAGATAGLAESNGSLPSGL